MNGRCVRGGCEKGTREHRGGQPRREPAGHCQRVCGRADSNGEGQLDGAAADLEQAQASQRLDRHIHGAEWNVGRGGDDGAQLHADSRREVGRASCRDDGQRDGRDGWGQGRRRRWRWWPRGWRRIYEARAVVKCCERVVVDRRWCGAPRLIEDTSRGLQLIRSELGHWERDCLLARDRCVLRVVPRHAHHAADHVEGARAIARVGRCIVIGRARIGAPEHRVGTQPIGHIGRAVVVVCRRVHAAEEGVHAVALALDDRACLVVDRRRRKAAVDGWRCAHGLVVHVGCREVVQVGRLCTAIDGKRAGRIGVDHARAVIVESSRVHAARVTRRLLLPTPGSAHAADVEGGVSIVVGRRRVGAARQAAAAAIDVVPDVCEIGRARVHAARKDRDARAIVGGGSRVEVERQTVGAAQIRALASHVHIRAWVVAGGFRVHAAGYWIRARRVRRGRRVEVARGMVEAAGILAGAVVDGRRHAIVFGGGVGTAKNDWGARAVVVRGRGLISIRA